MKNDIPIDAPAGFVPQQAIAFADAEDEARVVSASAPLPVQAAFAAATSSAVTGSLSASGQSATFTPELGRPIWVRLSGTWAGSVALERRIGAGDWYPVTLGGEVLVWTANRNEPAYEESVSGAQYRLNFTRTSGTLDYEVRQ